MVSRAEKAAQSIDNQPDPRLLTLKEAAARLGLTIWALRELIWSGLLKPVQFPGKRKLYVDSKDLDALVEKNKVSF